MAENPKPLDGEYVDNDIFKLVQSVGTPTCSWLTTSIKQAIKSRRRILSSREGTNEAPRAKPEGKDTTPEVVVLGVVNPPITLQQHRVIQQTSTPKTQGVRDVDNSTEPPGIPQHTGILVHAQTMNQTTTPNKYPAQIRLVDDNENNVKPRSITRAGKGIVKGTVYLDDDDLPPGREYFSEEEEDTQESYLDSDDSYTLDDDGHGGCGKGEYDTCPDKQENYYMYEEKDGDNTVIYVFNTNQVFLRDGDSQTWSFSSSGGDNFGSRGLDHDVVTIN